MNEYNQMTRNLVQQRDAIEELANADGVTSIADSGCKLTLPGTSVTITGVQAKILLTQYRSAPPLQVFTLLVFASYGLLRCSCCLSILDVWSFHTSDVLMTFRAQNHKASVPP
jgi:hypothetical protein